MPTPFPWMSAELAALESAGLRRARRVVRPLAGGACKIDGRRLWNFAGNDYLGLAGDPQVVAAAQTALSESGVGARASALVAGRTEWHARLEQALARFEGQEAAVLFPTGYAANVGTIAALVDENDVVVCDRLNHASLIDGCRLSGAKLRVFRHSELDTLERVLHKAAEFRRRLIVTDAVFSMDGDVAPLRELCDLAERFDADVLVDEAHGTGVFGEHGRGVCEHLGVEDRIAVRIGTLSKSIGTLGGFVAGSQSLVDWLWNKARPQVFSTALPPAICAAAVAAIEIIRSEPERRTTLWQNCEFVRRELAQLKIDVSPSSVGPIIPILLGNPDAAVAAQQKLEEHGCLVAAIRPPTVPHGTSRLRISLSAAHDESALKTLVAALQEAVSVP
ncbi:MAG: 8-amino-7-oxononanoate synthase [Planctomycetota bacterium]|nr:MAG: 8-amino-7-oxononanoate synthase [Planctomycetota bacterium]